MTKHQDPAKAGSASDPERQIHDGAETTKNGASVLSSEDVQVRHIPAAAAGSGLPGRQSTTSTSSTSNQSSGGDDADFDALGISQAAKDITQPTIQHSAPPPKLGNLHKRRASDSPEKFNTGNFNPLPLHINAAGSASTGPPPVKRARVENKVEISYDSVGAPRIASVTPKNGISSGKSTSKWYREELGFGTKEFSVFNALLRHHDLLLLLVSYLTVPSLISLYSISKPFHCIFNCNYLAFILSISNTWAPNAATIFPWRCFRSLCVRDPQLKVKSSMIGRHLQAQHQNLREIPSLKWLQMVVWRQGVCKDMLIQLATKGLRCPPGTLDAVRRMWLILDFPLNAQRIALCRSAEYITPKTIFLATFFFLKVDMAFTDPAGPVFRTNAQHNNAAAFPRRLDGRGTVGCDLRELLTSERNFTPLWRVLRGWSPDQNLPRIPMNRLDILKLWIRHEYRLPDRASAKAKQQSILGVPWHQVGTASLERTGSALVTINGKTTTLIDPGLTSSKDLQTHTAQQLLYPHAKRIIVPEAKPREKLMRPEELMMKEGVRRKMGLHRHWIRMMLWGFCDSMGRNFVDWGEEELVRYMQGKTPGLELFETARDDVAERAMEMGDEDEGKEKKAEGQEVLL
ncbi:hypothetical protein KC318_g6781 [Hortaea werneckii]|uniref:Uncharacterized protein n=1 Tax=Hortaea werneckii TaxID=91943 RepID=A0A3M6ZRL8_HORWE|nr:hypothetical protein KC334_g9147 [Hortaea werneckii]KAI7006810.1 hypothetical protein KC355_g7590 [Hortaea werneckii]KAI7665957.1 hypothetical protein KC318_g6781 [Hortaea werneckii]RMY17759.1 hypothetical protein D0866_13368 [Hortaea werneckii]